MASYLILSYPILSYPILSYPNFMISPSTYEYVKQSKTCQVANVVLINFFVLLLKLKLCMYFVIRDDVWRWGRKSILWTSAQK